MTVVVMSALGQKQPLKTVWILASEWLVLGNSGHSPLRISGVTSGCVRPEADVTHEGIAELRASYLTNIKGDQKLLDPVVTTGFKIECN
jgi:hypothetical protein